MSNVENMWIAILGVSLASCLPSLRYKGPYSLSSEIPNSLVLNYKEQPLLAMSAWRPC